MVITASPPLVLTRASWESLQAEHEARADLLTADHRDRASRREKHPVWDFLFTYYSYKPSVLRRWHPGSGIMLAEASSSPFASRRWYRTDEDGSVGVDIEGFLVDRGEGTDHIRSLIATTRARPARFGCFGLHEWAMVYRQNEHRHAVPLRLGRDGTDAVVEAHELRCTHFDAFRFFTPDAVARAGVPLTRETQIALEQPGCLHAGMDLYKWIIKLGPLVPGELLLDSFELARDIRRLDMEASPYDLEAWGFSPVRVENPEGKAEYVRRQRELSDRAQGLRARVLDALPA